MSSYHPIFPFRVVITRLTNIPLLKACAECNLLETYFVFECVDCSFVQVTSDTCFLTVHVLLCPFLQRPLCHTASSSKSPRLGSVPPAGAEASRTGTHSLFHASGSQCSSSFSRRIRLKRCAIKPSSNTHAPPASSDSNSSASDTGSRRY